MKNSRGMIRTIALLVCLVMIGTLLPVMASADLAAPQLTGAYADGTGIRVTWNAVAGADSYLVYRRQGSGSWKSIGNTTGTSFRDANAEEKVTYTYTVRCVVGGSVASGFNKTGVSAAWNKSAAGYTATPKLVSATGAANGVLVKWNKVGGATGYKVYRKTATTSWKAIANVGNVDSYVDTTAVSKTKYTYTVRSLKGTKVSSDFDKKGVTGSWDSGIAPGNIAAPKLIAAVSEGSGLRVSWNAVAGASAYRVYRKTGKQGWQGLVNVTGTNYLDNATNAGTVYYYTVRCLDGDGNVISSFDKKGVKGSWTAPTPGQLATPILIDATCAVNGVEVTWNPVTGAGGYRVYRDAGSGWKAIADVGGTSFVDQTAVSGSTYFYTVRAMEGGKVASSFERPGVMRTFYATPALKSAVSVTNGIQITWGAVGGAPMYRIYRKSGSGDFTGIGATTGTSYVDKKISVGVEYTYTVRVVSATDQKSPLSNYNHTGIKATFTGKSSISSLTNELNGVRIKWVAVNGAANYQVLRKTGEGNWVELTTTTGTSYLDTDAVNNTTHTYRVRAKDSAGNYIGSDDANGIAKTYYVAPTLTDCVRRSGGLLTTWEAVEGISNYVILRRYGVGDWERVGTSTGTSYQDNTPPSGTVCWYTVQCADGSGNAISAYREPGVNETSYMDQPILSAAVNNNGTITVSWNSVDKATNYRVWRRTGDKTSWDEVKDNTTALSWTDADVLKGKTYYYTVSVIDPGTLEELSEFNQTGVKATYYDPPTVTKIENAKGGVYLEWTAQDYIGRYQVYRKTGNQVSWTSVGTSTGTTFVDGSVVSNAHYIYAVTGMVNSADATALSNQMDITYYAAPQMSGITVGNGNMSISWKQEPGIDTYRVYRSTDGKTWTNLADVNAVSYTDGTANTVGQKYYYAVRCVKDGSLVSAMNNAVSATYIKAPQNVKAASGGTGKVKISWNANYGYKYIVQRRTVSSGWTTLQTGIESGSATFSIPDTGVTYYYRVIAVWNSDGTNSAPSGEVSY